MGALVAGNGRCRSRCWERSWVLSSLGTVAVALFAVALVAVALVAGIVHG